MNEQSKPFDLASWRAFCNRLGDIGEVILHPDAPRTELDQAEGFRYLARLVRLAMIWNMEATDTDHPLFFAPSDEITKPLGGDVPDIVYLATLVDGTKHYRIIGKDVNVTHFGIGSKVYRMHVDGTARSTGELEGGEMDWSEPGACEILLGRDPMPGNWLPMTEETNMILIRQTRGDRPVEHGGRFTIERIDAAAEPPAPLDGAALHAMLDATADFVDRHSRHWLDFILRQGFQKHRNTIAVTDQAEMRGAGGNPLVDIQYGYFDLAPDEVWVIEIDPPESLLWSFSLYNWWMESLDFRTRPTAINKATARYEDDGRLVLAIAARDPGFGNWLDTAGHREGYAYFRWTGAVSQPRPACRVVRIGER